MSLPKLHGQRQSLQPRFPQKGLQLASASRIYSREFLVPLPGSFSSDPRELTAVGDQLFFRAFDLNPATGVVTFQSAPDFETPQDAVADNVYNIQVTVTDSGSLSDVQDITITVTNVDDTPPMVQTLLPTDDATGIAVDSNLVVTFSEDVQKGTGNITIHLASDDSVVQTIEVGDAAVTVNGAEVMIDPADELLSGTEFYINIEAGAFADLNGNEFAGITDPTTWSFTTIPEFAVIGPDAGIGPTVQLFDADTGTLSTQFDAYESSFSGGVRVALGNLNGDTALEIITAPGAGRLAEIKVFDGVDQTELFSIDAFGGSFTGGVFVAAGDGIDDIIVGQDAGGTSLVEIYDGSDQSLVHSFQPYEAGFTGGIRVAGGNFNGDEFIDVLVGPGAGRLTDMIAFDGQALSSQTETELFNFQAMGSYDEGIYVAAGDLNGDGIDDPIMGKGTRGARVKAFDGTDQSILAGFKAFDRDNFRGAVRVAASDVNNDGTREIVVVSGPGRRPIETTVRVYDLNEQRIIDELDGFNPYPGFTGGAFLASDPPFGTGSVALRVAGGPAEGSSAEALTQNQLSPVVEDAIESFEELEVLESSQLSTLNTAEFAIADLPGDLLGTANSTTGLITIDVDAAGYGWYLGGLKADTEELFESGRVDLLTTVAHELGHLLGLKDLDAESYPDSLMSGYLDLGTRRVPSDADLDALFADEESLGKLWIE